LSVLLPQLEDQLLALVANLGSLLDDFSERLVVSYFFNLVDRSCEVETSPRF